MMRRINGLKPNSGVRAKMVQEINVTHCFGAHFRQWCGCSRSKAVESSISGHSGYGIVLADAFPGLLHCIERY
jgi:hypothetical protein